MMELVLQIQGQIALLQRVVDLCLAWARVDLPLAWKGGRAEACGCGAHLYLCWVPIPQVEAQLVRAEIFKAPAKLSICVV